MADDPAPSPPHQQPRRGAVGILANPMSGRDVRRLAARASENGPDAKRDAVARIAMGLDAAGVADLFVVREPFRIATGAVETLPLDAAVHTLDVGVTNSAEDTTRAAQQMRAMGCRVLVSLGGDGTNRVIADAWPDAVLLPVSTGTNNVFPMLVEGTVAGLAAGLVATGVVEPREAGQRAKVLELRGVARGEVVDDLALVDVVLLANDHLGNLLPFRAEDIQRVLLARAEPAAVGTSPIGGLLRPVSAADDTGLSVICGGSAQVLRVPLSPGLFGDVGIRAWSELRLGSTVTLEGPGVVAVDGDRAWKLEAGEKLAVTLRRKGPWVIDPATVLGLAAGRGALRM